MPDDYISQQSIASDLQSVHSAYVHIPFCRHRCGYCNFTLVAGRDYLIDQYIEALQTEIESRTRESSDLLKMQTIFLGGGTPTHLNPQQLDRLLRSLRNTFAWDDSTEFSTEANPNDICHEKANVLQSHGVNRLSLGAQSFDPQKLQQLERDHDEAQIRKAIEIGKDHFQGVSIDLIFGAPNETLQEWQSDLQKAISTGIDHVSTYGLTIEKGTQFWNSVHHGRMSEIDDELAAEMYESSIANLNANGFEHYEVSNFAKPKHRSQHNEAYWLQKPFFGFGPGAASFIGSRRTINHRSTNKYIKKILNAECSFEEVEELDRELLARERLVFGLRRLEGIDIAEFQKQSGFSVNELVEKPLQRFLDAGLLQLTGNKLALTEKGLLISDSLWPDFL